jgi:hypothetical protein
MHGAVGGDTRASLAGPRHRSGAGAAMARLPPEVSRASAARVRNG